MDTLPTLHGRRILILFPHMVTSGGALNYTLRLAGELAGQGATVAILVLWQKDGVCDLPNGVQVLSLSGPLTSSLGYWLLLPYWQARINRAITAWQPDVLVPQVFPSNWWGWLYRRKHPEMKLVWVCHEPSAFIHSTAWIKALQPWWKGLLARLLRPVLKRVDVALAQYSERIIANSHYTAAEVEQVYSVTADGVAWPGIDFAAYSADGKKERAILTVGRLTKFKRVEFLLKVFKEVLLTHPDLTYHIVGTGEEELALHDLARRLELESQVVFHGAVTAATLMELYRSSSLFLHGSVNEPFGMAPLEAIACGTPVVAHCSGGPKEFVTAECGRLVDSLAAEDWAKAVIGFFDPPPGDEWVPMRVRECARRFDWPLSLRPAVEAIAGLCMEVGRADLKSAGITTGIKR